MDNTDSRIPQALAAASEARDRAYAPYSNFKMGAAVVTKDDGTTQGALVENISFGLTMCAERAALYAVVAQGLGRAEILALVSKETDGELTWPCGACLQVAMELGGPDLLVVVSNGKGRVDQALIKDIAGRLPFKRARA